VYIVEEQSSRKTKSKMQKLKVRNESTAGPSGKEKRSAKSMPKEAISAPLYLKRDYFIVLRAANNTDHYVFFTNKTIDKIFLQTAATLWLSVILIA
jgi:hypothetical protein